MKEHHWVDLFPESKYQNGLRKILQVVTPLTFIIRHKPTELSSADVTEILKLHGYYDSDKNPDGKGIEHQYELKEINGDKVIFDKAMDLMWQQSGSVNRMNFEDAKREIRKLNQKCFAGFDDWRLPTVEEAMSLMEANKKDLYINSIFDSKKDWIWTADLKKDESRAWVIDFSHGGCDKHYLSGSYDLYVRAVRSGKSS